MFFIFIFADSMLHALNVPSNIFAVSKTYLLIITNFFTLNCYIQVISYFIKSDGRANLTLDAVLLANILNLIFDFAFYYLFGQNISSIAWALVAGYLISAVNVSRYYFEKNSTFKLIHPSKFKFTELPHFIFSAIRSTPELVSRIFNTVKVSLFLYLCATFLGDAGILAF